MEEIAANRQQNRQGIVTFKSYILRFEFVHSDWARSVVKFVSGILDYLMRSLSSGLSLVYWTIWWGLSHLVSLFWSVSGILDYMMTSLSSGLSLLVCLWYTGLYDEVSLIWSLSSGLSLVYLNTRLGLSSTISPEYYLTCLQPAYTIHVCSICSI